MVEGRSMQDGGHMKDTYKGREPGSLSPEGRAQYRFYLWMWMAQTQVCVFSVSPTKHRALLSDCSHGVRGRAGAWGYTQRLKGEEKMGWHGWGSCCVTTTAWGLRQGAVEREAGRGSPGDVHALPSGDSGMLAVAGPMESGDGGLAVIGSRVT